MVAYIPAPELCQGADQDLAIQMGNIIFPDFVHRDRDRGGLCLKVEGHHADRSLLPLAANRFQILLGIIRAWRIVAGVRADEMHGGVGAGPIRDGQGSVAVHVTGAVAYLVGGNEIEAYARSAKAALEASENLRNALWLNGRRDRNSADCYMIVEYGEREFGSLKAIADGLAVTVNDLKRLRRSANNLAPIDGGRHAAGRHVAEWSVHEQIEFTANLLKAWITNRGIKV